MMRRLLAEFLGSAGLVAAIIGSGIAASRLTPDDLGLQLLINALATSSALFVLITIFQPISGAHLNPVITLVDRGLGNTNTYALQYVFAQLAGGVVGAVLANVMFGLDAVSFSAHQRLGWPHALSEVIATAGLVVVIFVLVSLKQHQKIAVSVAAYIGAAFFATSSTAFANPAVTLGRVFSDTFAGIAPLSALGFLAAQIVGGFLGLIIARLLVDASVKAALAETRASD
ncbi:aquaporin [Leucobacter denitrificans]